MFRRMLLATGLLAGLSCVSRTNGPEESSGRFELTTTVPSAGQLISAPAQARYCARDTVLSVWSREGEWIAALALRIPWPADSARTLEVTDSTEQPGTAMLAVRPLRDSIGVARVGQAGSVTIEAGPVVNARFAITAPPPNDSGDSVKWTGRIAGVRVDTGGCPGPVAP